MKIDVITIFPETVRPYFDVSIMKRATEAGVADFFVHDLRDYTDDVHKTVDDTPYGGGAGMVLKVEPIYKAVQDIKNVPDVQNKQAKQSSKRSDSTIGTITTSLTSRTILLSAKGKRFVQKDAQRLGKYDHLIFICGRYEGVDERVAQNIADEELSIGDYVLTGGELGAMVVADSVVRLLPGVLGNEQSAVHESHNVEGEREHPHYTKPEEFNGWRVPDVLRSGDHKHIKKWRKENGESVKSNQ